MSGRRGNNAKSSAHPGPLLQRSSLREQVKDVILQRIVNGTYRPGSRLVETRIAQEIGVSQASVREALRDLEHIGCVVYQPYRGCSVRKVSIDELIEAFPVRAALEALAARLAAENVTDEELSQLDEVYRSMVDAAQRAEPHDFSQADGDFHAMIVEAARNATLERQWESLEPYSRTFLTVSRPGTDLVALSVEHFPILEALEAHDPDRAAEAMHDHLLRVGERLASMSDAEIDAAVG